MSRQGPRRYRRGIVGLVLFGVTVLLLVSSARQPALAQDADPPHRLDLVAEFVGNYAIDASYQFDVVVDEISQTIVEATPPALSSSIEIPARLIGEERAEQLVRIDASRAVGFASVAAEVGWDCGDGLLIATSIQFTVSDGSTTTCAVTIYGPWRLEVELDETARSAGVGGTFFVGDNAGFGGAALFPGLFGSAAELRGSLDSPEPSVEWVANALVCDNGDSYPIDGDSDFVVDVARDSGADVLTCTIVTESIEAPPTTTLSIGHSVSSPSYPTPQSAWLQIDDQPGEEWVWFAPNTRTFEGARTVVVTEWLEPDGDWLTTGIACNHGVEVPWVDLGNGRSQATISLSAGQNVYCEFHYVYVPNGRARVRIEYPSQPGAPWLNYRLDREFARLMPGDTLELNASELGLEAPGILWTIDLACTTPDLILDRLPTQALDGSYGVYFLFDRSAGALDVEEVCTVVVEPAEPATIAWTKIYAADPDQEFVVTASERTATVRDGETVRFEVPLSTEVVSERLVTGTDIESVVCTLGEETFEFFPGPFDPVSLPDLSPGSELACTSTSVASSADVVELQLIHDGAGAPAVFTVQPSWSDPIVVTVEDQVVVEVPRSLTWIAMQPGSTRRFVDVTCDGFEYSRKDGRWIDPFYIEADAASCTLVSEVAANDPITINITGVLNTLDGPVPAFEAIDLSHRIGEPFLGQSWPTANPVVSIAEPIGWRAQLFQCSDGMADVEVSDRLELSINVNDVVPGTAIDCVVSFVPDFTIPLRFEVSVADEPDTVVDLAFELGDRVDAVRTVDGVATAMVRQELGSLRIAPQPIAGFDPGFAQCYNVFGADLVPDVSWGHWTIRWSSTSEILCELELRRVAPAQLVVESQIDGAAGNGGLRFDVSSAQVVLASEIIDGAGTWTLDVPIGEVTLEAREPATWTNLASSCDRDFDVRRTEAGFTVDFRGGEVVRCTFVNRLVSQDVGAPGDVTCDGLVDIIDALVIAQFEAQVRSSAGACPLGDAATELFSGAADFDGSGGIDILDALQVARCTVGLPAAPCAAAFEVD